jgi:hypothetical protein
MRTLDPVLARGIEASRTGQFCGKISVIWEEDAQN